MEKKKWKKWASAAAAAILIGIGGGEYISNNHPSGNSGPAVETAAGALLELPAQAEGEQTISYKGYVSSYNTRTLIPDWVAYELTAEEAGARMSREGKTFSMDMSFKGKQAKREDYRESGWSKGHMAPAADMAWDEEAMSETFYFTNICPQNEELNGNDWEYLERQVRRWAGKFGRVWVVSGPVVGDNIYGTIGERKVVVPDAFFKAVLAPDKKGGYQAVAFVMDNDNKRYYLEKVAMSVDELEYLTGIDFFPALPDEVEAGVERDYSPSFWGLRQ